MSRSASAERAMSAAWVPISWVDALVCSVEADSSVAADEVSATAATSTTFRCIEAALAVTCCAAAAICSIRPAMSSTELADLEERLPGTARRRRPRRRSCSALVIDDVHRLRRCHAASPRPSSQISSAAPWRLLGELAHLVGDDREPAALLAGAGGLDRGVEREQVRLLGDPPDGLPRSRRCGHSSRPAGGLRP